MTLERVRRCLFVSLLVTVGCLGGLVASSSVKADTLADIRYPNSCLTPSKWGFDRYISASPSGWNPCQTDSYGPYEYIYWNYLSAPGYNNPGAGPYISQIAAAIGDWAYLGPWWQFTYKSGDWSTGTSAFFEQTNLFPVCGTGCYGLTHRYFCTSSSSCAYRTPGIGTYNLIYMYLHTGGVDKAVVVHELGHGFGIKHPADPTPPPCPSNNPSVHTIMNANCIFGGPNLTSPQPVDTIAVDLIYPEGSY
jgi:hypothetical protein